MSRGLPWSVILHLMALGALAAWGGHVPQPPLEPQRVMKVQLARMPAAQPQVSQPAAELEPESVVPVVEPVPQPPPKETVLPPKDVPEVVEKKPEPPAKTEPDPVPVKPDPEPQAPPDDAPESDATPLASGPARVSDTSVDFPFAWYLNGVESRIARKWQPKQLGFREGSARSCVVHFYVERSGQITGVNLMQTSGVSLFDREALRAVKSVRLPPLPAKFPERQLGVTFVFTLESGI